MFERCVDDHCDRELFHVWSIVRLWDCGIGMKLHSIGGVIEPTLMFFYNLHCLMFVYVLDVFEVVGCSVNVRCYLFVVEWLFEFELRLFAECL